MNYQLSAYDMTIRDDILTFVTAINTREASNAGRTRHRGVEASVGAALTPTLRVDGSYSNAIQRYVSWTPQAASATGSGVSYSGNLIEDAPRDLASVLANWQAPVLNGGRVALEWSHTGGYDTDPANTQRYGGYDLLNLLLNARVTSRTELFGRVANLANRTYAELVTYDQFQKTQLTPGGPRSVYLGVKTHVVMPGHYNEGETHRTDRNTDETERFFARNSVPRQSQKEELVVAGCPSARRAIRLIRADIRSMRTPCVREAGHFVKTMDSIMSRTSPIVITFSRSPFPPALTSVHREFKPAEELSVAGDVGTAPMFAVAPNGTEARGVGVGAERRHRRPAVRAVDGKAPVELRDSLGPIEPHGESPPKLAYSPDGALNALYVVGKEVPGGRIPCRGAAPRELHGRWSSTGHAGDA